MTSKTIFPLKVPRGIFTMLTITLIAAGPALSAQTETVIHSFPVSTGGVATNSNLVRDAAGNFFCTTRTGGSMGYGSIVELSPPAAGETAWTANIVHTFGVFATDGNYPSSYSLIVDSAGNLYGTTSHGGAFGAGTVFKLMPSSGGWTEKVLFSFQSTGTAPKYPGSNLILDSAGNFYGVAGGGFYSNGSVYELSPRTSGGLTLKTLHSFGAFSKDGIEPDGLILDGAGNLYGTTYMGGAHTASNVGGTVFELTPPAASGGNWIYSILHSFGAGPGLPSDGWDPIGGLVEDGAGNLYGTSYNGGLYGGENTGGTVWEISPVAGGGWTETVLHNFSENQVDGFWPQANLTLDAAGNLYGTAQAGGSDVDGKNYDLGVVFELSPPAAGATSWTETILHSFGAGKDGQSPISTVIFDGASNLYGTTNAGGNLKGGTVWQVTP